MNEQSFNLIENCNFDVCCVCFSAENVRAMSFSEENWYQNIIFPTSPQPLSYKTLICLTCVHYLKKTTRFSTLCRNSQVFLSQAVQQGITTLTHKPISRLSKTPLEIHYIGPNDDITLTDDLKASPPDEAGATPDDDVTEGLANVSDDNDDVPLVFLTGELSDRKKKHKKARQKPSKERENKSASEKDGFSSRMVRETAEYTVIKLTKEQVVSELSVRARSWRYRRAPHRCAHCVKGFNFRDVLARHMAQHEPSRGAFRCDICSQYCPSAVSLRGHIKSHTTRYKCKVCGCVRLSRQHLLEHHAISHAAPTVYSCDQCPFTSNKRTVMQRHVRRHRAPAPLRCEHCDRRFACVSSLRVHRARHSSACAECEECGRRFVFRSQLERHAQAVHRDRLYYCVECDINFKSPDNLRLHFKKAKKHRDSSAYTHECAQCSQRFLSSASLQAHGCAAHGQPRRFACACGRLYASRDARNAHQRRAHAQHRHACHLCAKTFARKSTLTVHLRSHGNTAPAQGNTDQTET